MTVNRGHEWPSRGVPNSIVLQKPFALPQLVTAVSRLLIDQNQRGLKQQ
jgi:hypothetical protein